MNYYSNQTVFGANIPCTIKEGKIYQLDYMNGSETLVGISIEESNQKDELLESYYNKLVEVGAIEKEKTPEEVQKEQTELINKLLTKIDDLEKKVSKKDEPKRYDKKNGSNDELSR